KVLGDPNFNQSSVPDVTINGENIYYDNVIVKKVDLHFKNVSINLSDKTIKSCDEATADIMISEDNLSKLIENYSSVNNPKVITNNDKITLKGGVSLLGQNVDLEVTGSVYVKKGKELYLEPDSFKVMKLGVTVPNVAKGVINNIINPVYKIKDNPYDLYIDSFTYKDGYIYATAHFDSVKIMQAFKESLQK
ncbi:MAG: DUF2993 domain-containing protein, partial [Abditibacteriota bacterium]|nr:DUF2993 domain-containing protein [Abditibacteriota bacterium]